MARTPKAVHTAAQPMNLRIFYAWQSDLPNRTNRGLIEKALERAATRLGATTSIGAPVLIDRDTRDVPGFPNIPATIQAKIEAASAFVCDLSIIHPTGVKRPTPNPNVLTELGYAIKALGTERIIAVVNTAFGPVGSLPFDIDRHRVMTYAAPDDGTDLAPVRSDLEHRLHQALELILRSANPTPEDRVDTHRARTRQWHDAAAAEFQASPRAGPHDQSMPSPTDNFAQWSFSLGPPTPASVDTSELAKRVQSANDRMDSQLREKPGWGMFVWLRAQGREPIVRTPRLGDAQTVVWQAFDGAGELWRVSTEGDGSMVRSYKTDLTDWSVRQRLEHFAPQMPANHAFHGLTMDGLVKDAIEFLLFAAAMAELFGCAAMTVSARWIGLAGRQLWSSERERADPQHERPMGKCYEADAEATFDTGPERIRDHLSEELVKLLSPLLRLFGGFAFGLREAALAVQERVGGHDPV